MRSTPTREFSLYYLDEAGSAVGGNCSLPFSAACYSKYKYGSVMATETFAQALGAALGDRLPEVIRAPGLLRASSPYSYVPTAATGLARRLWPVLNAARARYGLAPAPLVKVDRITTSAGDYGTLSALARDRHMAANALSFRRFRSDLVRGAHLIVVDDVKVTGAHQRCLIRASEGLPFSAQTFLYIAAFAGSSGKRVDPVLEDVLNHAAVKALGDLAGIVRTADFAWNVRACKFLLNPANRGDLPGFLAGMPDRFVRDLYRNSLQDGYAQMDIYAGGHAIVRAELDRRSGSLCGRPLLFSQARRPQPAPVRTAGAGTHGAST
jgi:PRTase ComF-like